MPLDLLLTVHERGALEKACQQGFWLPMPIQRQEVPALAYLVVLHPEADAVAEVAPINSVEFLFTRDGEDVWLPFLAPLRHLRHPVPLGSGGALQSWLPISPQQYRLLEIDRLLAAETLAELISGWEEEGHRPAQDPAA